MPRATVWSVSATNFTTEERWMVTGTKAECTALLKLKQKEWGGSAKTNIEWSEHPLPANVEYEEE